MVARGAVAQQPQPSFGVSLGSGEVAHLLVHRFGARVQVAGVVAHDQRRGRGTERDHQQDHGGDEQRRALSTFTLQCVGRGDQDGR